MWLDFISKIKLYAVYASGLGTILQWSMEDEISWNRYGTTGENVYSKT